MEIFFKNHNKEGGEPAKVQFIMLLLSFARHVANTMGDEAIAKYSDGPLESSRVKMGIFVSAYGKLDDNYRYRYELE